MGAASAVHRRVPLIILPHPLRIDLRRQPACARMGAAWGGAQAALTRPYDFFGGSSRSALNRRTNNLRRRVGLNPRKLDFNRTIIIIHLDRGTNGLLTICLTTTYYRY